MRRLSASLSPVISICNSLLKYASQPEIAKKSLKTFLRFHGRLRSSILVPERSPAVLITVRSKCVPTTG